MHIGQVQAVLEMPGGRSLICVSRDTPSRWSVGLAILGLFHTATAGAGIADSQKSWV